jgi:C4-type Zn-finger protein
MPADMKYYAITTTITITDDKGNKALAGEYAKKPKLTTTGNHKLY